jgi:hypothetical protein
VTAVEASVEERVLSGVYASDRGASQGLPWYPDETRGDVSRRRRPFRTATAARRRAERAGRIRVGWETAARAVGA